MCFPEKERLWWAGYWWLLPNGKQWDTVFAVTVWGEQSGSRLQTQDVPTVDWKQTLEVSVSLDGEDRVSTNGTSLIKLLFGT